MGALTDSEKTLLQSNGNTIYTNLFQFVFPGILLWGEHFNHATQASALNELTQA